MLTAAMNLKSICSLEGDLIKILFAIVSYGKLWQHIKKQRHHFGNKDPCSQTMIFPVVMYGYESWTIKEG